MFSYWKTKKVLHDVQSFLHSVVSYVCSWIRLYWMIRRLPGPSSSKAYRQWKGSILNYDAMGTLLQWQAEYKTCHKVFLSFLPVIFAYSPEVVQEILSKKQKHNDKGNVYHTLLPLLGDGLITSKGEKWFTRRRMLTPAFHFNILASFFETFKSETTHYINSLKNSKLMQGYEDICPFTRRLTLNFICETAMGFSELGELKHAEAVIKSMHKLEEIATLRVLRPWLLCDAIFKMSTLYLEMEENRKILHGFSEALIKRRKQELIKRNLSQKPDRFRSLQINKKRCIYLGPLQADTGLMTIIRALPMLKQWIIELSVVVVPKKKEIFLDLLIHKQFQGEKITDDDIRDEVNTFMFAGHNTTQLAINYSIYLFGRYEDVQEKAYNELDGIFKGSSREPTMEDLRQMQYLDRCIKEALRLYPSVPIIARRLTEDQPIGNAILPKDADCFIIPYITHRNPEQFPNPENFDPDNFLPERVKARHPYSYIPFSAGPRNCIGKRFANIAEKTVLSWILREFIIKSSIKQEELKLIPSTVLIPHGGLKVKLMLRKKNDNHL